MAHLPVREKEGRIYLEPALQGCVRQAARYRAILFIARFTIAAGGVVILVLLQLWDSSAIASFKNLVIEYAMTAIAALVSLATTLASTFNFEGNSIKHQTAARALRRLMDRYETSVAGASENHDKLKQLELWAKSHVYQIENLIEDPKVLDVDMSLNISEPT